MEDPNGRVDKCHGRWSLLPSKTARVGKPTPEWSAWHGRWSCLDGMGQVKQVQQPSEMGSHGRCTLLPKNVQQAKEGNGRVENQPRALHSSVQNFLAREWCTVAEIF